MDTITKNAITYIVTMAVAPVAADHAWSIYKGSMPDGSPVPVGFKLPGAVSTSSSAAMTVVERK